MTRVASCSADISKEKNPDDPAIDGLVRSVGFGFGLIGARDIEGDVGGERRLAHAGTPGDDDKIGFLQAAHLVVEIEKAGGDARQMAVAHVGAARHIERGGERVGEALKAAVVAASLGDRIELALGLLDLRARRRIDRRVIGRVDDVLADDDELAANRKVMHGAAIVFGVDDRRRLSGESRQIGLDRHARRQFDLGEERLERDDGRELAGANELRRDFIDAAVQFLREMLGL